MKFYYNLPSLNKEIMLEVNDLEKQYFTLIYGFNGVGKSSFANAIHKNSNNNLYNEKNNETLKNYQTHLFNRNYIFKNVYISDDKGYNSTTKHNQYWGDIFLGNNINSKITEFEKISSIRNNLKWNFSSIDFQALIDYIEEKTKIKFTIEELNKVYNSNFIQDISKQETSIMKHYKINNKNDSFFYDKTDIEKIEYVCKRPLNFDINEISNEIIRIVDENQLVLANELIKIYNEDINKELLKLSDFILKYNNDFTKIKLLDNALDALKLVFGNDFIYTDDIKEWINTGIKLHESSSLCMFCGNENLSLLTEHKIILKNEIQVLKDNINNIIKNINSIVTNKISPIKKILNKQHLISPLNEIITKYSKLYPIIKSSLDNKTKIIQNINNINEINFHKIEPTKNTYLVNFLLEKNPEYHEEIKKMLYKKELDSKYKKISEEIECIMNDNKEEIKNIINSSKTFLGIDEEVSLEIKKSPGASNNRKPQLLFMKDGKNIINAISYGQRFKFALLLFIENIKLNIKNNKESKHLIIFDDPIDSADMFTYFSFKSLLISFVREKDIKMLKIKIIILTHNIDYAMVQFNTDEKKLEKIEFIKMFKNRSLQISYQEMFTNDKLMFLKLHDLLITRTMCEINLKIHVFQKDLLIFYLCLVRKFLEHFLEEIYVFNSKKNLDVEKFKNCENHFEWIKNNLDDPTIVKLCEKIKNIIMNLLNNKWLAKKTLGKEEINRIFSIVLEIKKRNCIKISETEEMIFNNYYYDKNLNLTDIDTVIGTEEINKYFIASKILAKKDSNQESTFEFIKTFLRHYNSNFLKPFIAFDEEILNKIIE